MEDTKSKIFFNRADSSIILLLGTMLFGGIVIFFGYIISRYTRYHDDLDSTKDGKKNKGFNSRDSFAGSSTTTTTTTAATATTATTMTTTTTAATSNVNKRAKNKKRREVQQEFSHSWVVGTLKGHTSTIFNMSFSSNGKQLASCAEDGKRPREMVESVEGEKTGTATATATGTATAGTTTTTTTATTTTTTTRPKATVPATASPYSLLPLNQQKITARCNASYYGLQKNRMKYGGTMYNHLSPPSYQPIKQGHYVWTLGNAEFQYLQPYIPEYNQNKNACKLNHYQQEARNFYFHQLYVQLMSIQQQLSAPGCGLIQNYNNHHWQFNNLYQQRVEQLPPPHTDIGFDYQYSTLIGNGVSPYWMEGRYPSKKTYGFVQTKRNEFIINDTVLEYVLRTYVHHPLYLIEAGYPYTWNFDARFQQFVKNLHKPFVLKNTNGQGMTTMMMLMNNNNNNNNNNNVLTGNDKRRNKLDNTEEQQTRDGVRSSSFTSSSRRAYLDECNNSNSNTITRQRSSSISTVGELNALETRCSMCLKGFYLYRANGDLNRQEVCIHHPGELIFHKQEKIKTWTCCGNRASVLGCKTETAHIWRSFKKNFASPHVDYVRTKPSEIQPENRIYGIYGIDCEMVTTRNGLELGKVSLVNIHGHVVYNEYVIPESEVVDCNTRYSGITLQKLSTATKTLKKVQQDLLEYIKAETILVGHALENDLKVLRIIHYTCIDTALLLKHPDDLPFRNSLRVLSRGYLKRIIQKGSHNPVEDTVAALDLVLFKLRDDGF